MKNKIITLISIFFFLLVFSQFLYSLRGILNSVPIDFLHYYLSSEALLSGQNPYVFVPIHKLNNGMTVFFNYPPTALLFFWPLALFPANISILICEILIFVALMGVIFTSLKILKIRCSSTCTLCLVTCALLSFPIRHTFGMGQVSIFILLMLLVSFYLANKQKPVIAGLFLALAISLKVYPIFILPFLLLKRQIKYFISTIIFMFIFVLISYLLVGFQGWQMFLKVMPKPDYDFIRASYYEQNITAFLARLDIAIFLKQILFIILESILIIGTGWKIITSRGVKHYAPTFSAVEISLLLTILTVATGFTWQHYYALMIFPLLTCLKSYIFCRDVPACAVRPWHVSTLKDLLQYIPIILLISAYILISLNIKNPAYLVNHFGLFGTLILSHELYGAMILWGMLIKSKKVWET